MRNDRTAVKKNIDTIRNNIKIACRKSGRSSDKVKLMAVTKTQERPAIEAALHEGVTLFGENRIQEAMTKFTPIPDQVELHLIGHLQRNKAKKAADFFKCIESIDKLETARVLEEICTEKNILLPVLLEVNTSGEDSKNGYRDSETLFRDLDQIMEFKHIEVQGLMTIGPFTTDQDRIRQAFISLRKLFERVTETRSPPRFSELSMGMTGDYQTAVEEGSTIIRIGTGIFGGRTA